MGAHHPSYSPQYSSGLAYEDKVGYADVTEAVCVSSQSGLRWIQSMYIQEVKGKRKFAYID